MKRLLLIPLLLCSFCLVIQASDINWSSETRTLAAQYPALAAGSLAGRHNLNRFLLNPGTGGIDLLAYGECNKCVLPAMSICDAIF